MDEYWVEHPDIMDSMFGYDKMYWLNHCVKVPKKLVYKREGNRLYINPVWARHLIHDAEFDANDKWDMNLLCIKCMLNKPYEKPESIAPTNVALP